MNISPVEFPEAMENAFHRSTHRKPVYVLRRQKQEPFGKISPEPLWFVGFSPANRGSSSVQRAEAIAASHSISDRHRHRIAGVLKFIMERTSTLPNHTFIDDECSLEWRYGRESLELSIPDSNQEIYVRITDAEGRELKVAFLDQISEDERDAAVRISQAIEAASTKEP